MKFAPPGGVEPPDPASSDTLADLSPPSAVRTVVAGEDPPSRRDPTFESRYEALDVLGIGGMGEVRLCRDARFGREVAVKVIRSEMVPSKEARARFEREARIQGQLEHPTIVPVHDFGETPAGEIYFTMKRVRGSTLEELLAGQRRQAPGEQGVSLRKLLQTLCSVCLAVDFAHSKGIVHRDLKPANVMLGDFGEVHLLDWGLAKPMADAEPPSPATPQPQGAAGPTVAGAILGTPGYIAPEQLIGAVADARTDVYALGAILFEILTLEPLNLGETTMEILLATRRGPDATERMQGCGRAIPPELVQVCAAATAREPAERTRSARELHDAIERYLEGDRDLELRRTAAAQHLHAAQESLARAVVAEGPAEAERAEASREVATALALDPASPEARRALLRLLTSPPRAMPVEVVVRLQQSARDINLAGRKTASFLLWGWLASLPLVLWMGVREWWSLILAFSMIAGALVMNEYARRTRDDRVYGVVLGLMAISVGLAARMFGPFILVPALATALAAGYGMRPFAWQRIVAIVVALLAVLIPTGLEALGLWRPSHQFHDGVITLLPRGTSFPRVPTLTMLLTITLAAIAAPSVLMSRMRTALMHAEARLQLQAWQLRQLVPDEAREAMGTPRDEVAAEGPDQEAPAPPSSKP